MNHFAAFLAAEHLQDLLREAETERRARLVRGATRKGGPSGAIRGTVAALTGWLRHRPVDGGSATAAA